MSDLKNSCKLSRHDPWVNLGMDKDLFLFLKQHDAGQGGEDIPKEIQHMFSNKNWKESMGSGKWVELEADCIQETTDAPTPEQVIVGARKQFTSKVAPL